ncbi:glycosyltransferase family 4 protein [Aquiflexum sp. TKW24L]|uniref:glycosyltransferase family 4 protein n=1 Tax=Aquiflexum sp. TKW24L TaxID=2942212 RepID=UPI0020BF42E1|nr:glycosyltransferase family 1 protein [Aquiflexum sp. TKW24L]MCL6260682.1 glycosyltransferase family 4 protein [Aquiflexum sp. TKW24L]
MKTKSVLIDGRWAGDTGIGRLYKEVMALTPAEADCSFVQSNMGLGSLFSPLMLANEIRNSTVDIFYSPSFMPPLFSKVPFIFTIHDLMHLFYYSKLHGIYYRQVIARLASKAKHIITVSHYSKQQLIDLLGIREEIISVIYNGVDASFLSNSEEISLGRPYFLYVGNRRKNKNIPAMMAAFAAADIPEEFVFALSGKPDEGLDLLIKKLGIEKRVRFLGFIPENELPKYYKGAYATLFVSLMEGFGLPLIESMASRTPVLTSSGSALSEVAGGAALCVDPLSVEAMKSGIEQMVNDRIFYQKCVEKGFERAGQFSWETTAQKTWDLILS